MRQKRNTRGLSANTLELLLEIEDSRETLFRASSVPSLLQEVAASREPRSLLYLRELMMDRRPSVRDAACQASASLLADVPPHDWAWLDETVRGRYIPEVGPGKWYDLRPIHLAKFVETLADPVPLLVLAMCHPNGFVREAALELGRGKHARVLPIVLIRLRDWVPQVRAAAARTWNDTSRDVSPVDQLVLLPLFIHLVELEPTDEFGAIASKFRQALLDENAEALRAGLGYADPLVRRYCFVGLLREFPTEADTLFDRAVEDADPLVQEWAISSALDVLPEADRSALLRRATGAKQSRVRLRALRTLWHIEHDGARNELLDALLAPSHSVREFAIWALRKIGSFDPAAFYRSRLETTNGRARAAVLSELGRWGDASDVVLMKRDLDDSSTARVRSAAMRAVYRLEPAAARCYYERSLQSESRRVARTARDLLVSDSSFPACADAIEWARSAEHDHSRIYATAVINNRCGKWQRLRALLELLIEGDPALGQVAYHSVGDWLETANRSSVTITAEDAERIRWLLARCGDLLPDDWIERIHFWVR